LLTLANSFWASLSLRGVLFIKVHSPFRLAI
jgi:hypothetical protein